MQKHYLTIRQSISIIIVLISIAGLYRCTLNAEEINTGKIVQKILDDKISRSSLRNYLEMDNEVTDVATVLSFLTRTHDQNIVSLLRDVWNQDYSINDNFDWELLENPRVRLALALNLAQRDPNRNTVYRNYILSMLDSSDPLVQVGAITALGTISTEKDLEKLLQYAKQEDSVVSVSAIYSISYIKTKKAYEAISSLRDLPSAKNNEDISRAIDDALSVLERDKRTHIEKAQ